MTKHPTPRDPNRTKKAPTGNYPNGYARPPVTGQTKKGEVRNPWGPKGKPKPEAEDSFEFAASQVTAITLNGEQKEVSAEAAVHLVAFKLAISGNTRAQKNIQEERRSRRRGQMVAPPTREDLVLEQEDEAKRKELSASLVKLLVWQMEMKKKGVLDVSPSTMDLAPWVWEAIGDYMRRHPERSFGSTAPDGPIDDS